MHIMVDANIIISAGLFPESVVGTVLRHILKNHQLVLCQYTLDELKNVFEKKFPKRVAYLNTFVDELKFKLICIEITDYTKYPKIRDSDDIPLLANAIEAKVDILLSGDKDFDELIIETPKILKPRQYIEKYIHLK